VYRLVGSGVDDPASARCPDPAIVTGATRSRPDHLEVDVRFTCEKAVQSGTIYLPGSSGRHPGVVWVHAAGKATRLTWGGNILPGLVRAGVVVFSYDKRGAGASQGKCCPGDTGHFNLLTADVVGAVAVLRHRMEVDGAQVGLVGASQAGWIAPRAANHAHAAFVALASAPAAGGVESTGKGHHHRRDGESNRRWRPGDGTFEDGSIIGSILGTDEGGASDVVYDFTLTLPDLPAYADPLVDRDDVVKLASSWVRATDLTVHRLIYYWTVRDQSS
jgi:hypothetical protein